MPGSGCRPADRGQTSLSNPRFQRLLDRFDHFDPEFEDSFFDVANELRQRCPVAHSDAHGGFWIFSRYADVQDGFGDERRFTSVPTVTIPVNPAAVPIIPLQCEPDVHRDFRRILDPYFRAGAVAKYADGIRQITTELIDSFIEAGRCEFIGDFARPLPGALMFRLFLGLPESEMDEAFRLTMAIMHSLGTPEAEHVHRRFMALISAMLDRRREEPPRRDVIDALLGGTVQGRRLTEDEVERTLIQLIAAGLDTTAHALGTMIIALTRRPDIRTRLEEKPADMARAVEELLRWEPPAGGLVRTAVDDVEVGGRRVGAGDPVLLLVAAANRDNIEYERPDQIDLDRPQGRHLSFGYGAHYCLGVHLARLELRVALEELLRRVRDVRITDTEISYDSGTSRGPAQLHLEFTPGRPSTAGGEDASG
jgi:cytochrome P450